MEDVQLCQIDKMTKKIKVFFIMFVFLIFINVVGSAPKEKVRGEVYDKLEESKDVRVIVNIKTSEEKGVLFKTQKTPEEIEKEKQEIKEKIIDDIGKDNVKHIFDEEIAVSVSNKDLDKLNENDYIEFIIIDKPIYAFLQQSIPLINATNVWPIQISGINITGIDETICILDTGVNFTHLDLVGRNLTCIIDCVGKACVEDCSIGDDNGHGTHVAGIAAAYGGIEGVAINVSLIGVKVLDETGSGTGSDLNAGIDWCISNAETYNISVISMSLGDCSNHSIYCNDDSSASLINNATEKNISVIVAAGNGPSGSCAGSGINNTQGPAAPACVQNATAVGAVNDNDAISYQRGALFELLAPGIGINSTKNTGGYIEYDGTSMAAPHVAGAFALIRQFFILQNSRVPTPDEIKETLNNTGVMIDDSAGSGYIFPRVNVLEAIISLDSTNPAVTLISPIDGTSQISQNVTFQCSANDAQLSNLTLYVWNSSDVYNNTELKQVNGVNANEEVNLTDISFGDYEWNCLVYDNNGNFSFASSNHTLKIRQVNVSLTSPLNNAYTNVNQTNFICLSETADIFNLTNITFFIWNSTNDLSYNETKDISGIHNSTTFEYNLTNEENYSWNCLALNNDSQSAYADANFTINFDLTSPTISSVASSVTYSSAIVTWTTNELANGSVNYGSGVGLGSYNSNSTLTTNHSISLSGLSASTTYYYNLSSCDETGNCIVNGTYSLITSAADSGGTISSSGGTATSAAKIYTLTTEQASSGYTQTLSKDDKIKFTFFDKSSGEHTLTIKEITKNSVGLTIKSEPITLTLGIGQSAKLNLTSAEYYDLYIKLNSIKNNKADITIQIIQEEIPKPLITGEAVEDKEEKPETKEKAPQKKGADIDKVKNILIILLILSVLILLIERLIKEKIKVKLKKLKKKLRE